MLLANFLEGLPSLILESNWNHHGNGAYLFVQWNKNKEMWKCKRHYVLIQEPVRYEICDEKEGEWDLGLQNASFRLCSAILIYDLAIKIKK